MFAIRRIHNAMLPANREAIAQAHRILREQLPGLPQAELDSFPQKAGGLEMGCLRPMLFVAERSRDRILGFALAYFCTIEKFTYLHYLAADSGKATGGIGGALYEHVREEAHALASIGLFFECLPDDPQTVADPQLLENNRKRLRFYERYGARPIIGTAYETPIREGSLGPYLMFDDLGTGRTLGRDEARQAVRITLENFYASLCPPEYVQRVVESFQDDPVKIRPGQYTRQAGSRAAINGGKPGRPITLVINDRHEIHHVRDRGYVESPVRIRSILEELNRTDLFSRIEPQKFPDKHIRAVHDPAFVAYLKRVCEGIAATRSVYPYVFPIRNPTRPPLDMAVRAGYYCIDTFTPLNGNAYVAAARSVDCALTAAQAIERGQRFAYALVRPPGHHAERRSFGGFCYFNSNAIAAHYLSAHGKIAILDIDYHHGNGQQDIFYNRADVLTISIHGHPRFAYPYFSGFDDEKGEGDGFGFNINYPLAEKIDGVQFRDALSKALRQIQRYKPAVLIIALGFDTAKHDPTGTWSLTAKDFEQNGRMIAHLGLPTLVIQEGGYRTRTLGVNARHFFTGLAAEANQVKPAEFSSAAAKPPPESPASEPPAMHSQNA